MVLVFLVLVWVWVEVLVNYFVFRESFLKLFVFWGCLVIYIFLNFKCFSNLEVN